MKQTQNIPNLSNRTKKGLKFHHTIILGILIVGAIGLASYKPKSFLTKPTNTPTVTIELTPPTTLSNGTCQEHNGLPDSTCTPGAINPAVTQATIQSTICLKGYTKTIRPPVSYTNTLKLKQITEYGYSDTNPKSYEEDHLISLELGGSPTDPKNLWPEPYLEPNGAHTKDKIENLLHSRICSGQITLLEAQREISTNWEAVK